MDDHINGPAPATYREVIRVQSSMRQKRLKLQTRSCRYRVPNTPGALKPLSGVSSAAQLLHKFLRPNRPIIGLQRAHAMAHELKCTSRFVTPPCCLKHRRRRRRYALQHVYGAIITHRS
jgi:hypothetical protein